MEKPRALLACVRTITKFYYEIRSHSILPIETEETISHSCKSIHADSRFFSLFLSRSIHCIDNCFEITISRLPFFFFHLHATVIFLNKFSKYVCKAQKYVQDLNDASCSFSFFCCPLIFDRRWQNCFIIFIEAFHYLVIKRINLHVW